MRTVAKAFVLSIVVLQGALPALGALLEVDTPWLETHQLTISAGDTVRVVGSASCPRPAMENIQWQGGELRLVNCRLAAGASRVPGALPLVVSSGQSLLLEQSWIEGAETALVMAGGSATLNQVTLASTTANILCVHPASHLVLSEVQLCNAAIGLQADSCATVLIQGALFLTNGTGLRVGPGVQVQLQDCLFQGNEWAIRVGASALPPQFLGQVDLVGARYGLIENLSPVAVELGDTHVDNPAQLIGLWTRVGVNPPSPVHTVKGPTAPIVIDDDELFESFIINPQQVTEDGIPCNPSLYRVYESTNPYHGFHLCCEYSTPTFHLTRGGQQQIYYRVSACIGEWGAGQ